MNGLKGFIWIEKIFRRDDRYGGGSDRYGDRYRRDDRRDDRRGYDDRRDDRGYDRCEISSAVFFFSFVK